MDPIELSALGAAGSALLAALSYWAKTNHERRRVTRMVLFYLLEFHHLANRTHHVLVALENEFVSELKLALARKGLEFEVDQGFSAVKHVRPYLERFVLQEIARTVSETAGGFEKSLVDLARENPVLAFRLRGREKLVTLSSRLHELVGGSVSQQPGLFELSEMNHHQLDRMFLKFATEELQTAIKSAAWGCDVFTHAKVLILLRNSKYGASNNDFTVFIGRLVDEYMLDRGATSLSPGPASPSELQVGCMRNSADQS